MKRNKYRAKPTTIDGITFHSKGEAGRYNELKLLERAGEISGLELQPSYPIVINGQKVCKVVLDFRYTIGGKVVVEDFKGMDTAISRLKRKLVKACHGVEVVLIK